MLGRILVIAHREFVAAVFNKAFIIGVLMLPVIMAASVAVQVFAQKKTDLTPRRFAVLVRAALEWASRQTTPISIIHAHDWQTGLVPAYLKKHCAGDEFFAKTRSVFTVHNMAYQGNFPRAALEAAGHPVVRIVLRSPGHIGQEFFRFEMATAVAGAVLGGRAGLGRVGDQRIGRGRLDLAETGIDRAAGDLALAPHPGQDGLQILPILLARVLRQGGLRLFQFLRPREAPAELAGGMPPLADPAVGVTRIVSEHP